MLFYNKILALTEPLIMSVGIDIVMTLTLVNIKYSKYFFSLRIVCVVVQFAKHKSPS